MDIWALGCVLYHLATLEPPFYGENLITLGYNIVHKFPKPIGNTYSHKLSAFIFKLLEKSPTNRPRIHDILQYFPSNFQTMRWKSLSYEGSTNRSEEKVNNFVTNESESPEDTEKNSPMNRIMKGKQHSEQIITRKALNVEDGRKTDSSGNDAIENIIGEQGIRKDRMRMNTDLVSYQKHKTFNKFTVRNLDGFLPPVQNAENMKPKLIRNSSQQNIIDGRANVQDNTSVQFVIEQTVSGKIAQKNNENENTAENKLKMITTSSDLQGNDSTLSAKKFEQTTINNYFNLREERGKKQLQEKKSDSTGVGDNSLGIMNGKTQEKGVEQNYGFSLRRQTTTDDSTLEDGKTNQEPSLQSNPSNKRETIKKSTSSDFKKVMMNPLIKSSSQRPYLSSNKFAEIISLRNDANINVMKSNETIRHPSARTNQADYRVRPISVQMSKRTIWEPDRRPTENPSTIPPRDISTSYSMRKEFESIISHNEKSVGDHNAKNDSNFIAGLSENPSANVTQRAEIQSRNIRLRDLLRIQSDPQKQIELNTTIENPISTQFTSPKGQLPAPTNLKREPLSQNLDKTVNATSEKAHFFNQSIGTDLFFKIIC